MLAVQGFNESAGSADFLLEASLENRRLSLGAPAYFAEATPGRENGSPITGLVSEVIVSPGRGFYEGPIDVAMTCPTEEVEIRYTLDGSAPTATTGGRNGRPGDRRLPSMPRRRQPTGFRPKGSAAAGRR